MNETELNNFNTLINNLIESVNEQKHLSSDEKATYIEYINEFKTNFIKKVRCYMDFQLAIDRQNALLLPNKNYSKKYTNEVNYDYKLKNKILSDINNGISLLLQSILTFKNEKNLDDFIHNKLSSLHIVNVKVALKSLEKNQNNIEQKPNVTISIMNAEDAKNHINDFINSSSLEFKIKLLDTCRQALIQFKENHQLNYTTSLTGTYDKKINYINGFIQKLDSEIKDHRATNIEGITANQLLQQAFDIEGSWNLAGDGISGHYESYKVTLMNELLKALTQSDNDYRSIAEETHKLIFPEQHKEKPQSSSPAMNWFRLGANSKPLSINNTHS